MRAAASISSAAARLRRLLAGFLAGFLAALGALGAGCNTVDSILGKFGDVVDAGATRMTSRQVFDEPILLDVVGPMSVDVESFNGDVTVLGNSALDHAVVTVDRRATHGFGRSRYADASLEEIDYSVEVVPGDLGPAIRIRASTTHAEAHFQQADIQIELPEVYGVRVVTHNGDVLARDVAGPIDIVTDDGNVRVLTPYAMRRAVTIINHSGDIDYRVRGESSGTFDCEAVRGIVTHHVDFGELIVQAGTDHDSLRAMLNGGPNPIMLRAADGDIRVAVVDSPTKIGVFVVD